MKAIRGVSSCPAALSCLAVSCCAVVLLLSSAGLRAQPEEVPDYAPEYAQLEREERLDERSVFTKSFANEDGTTTVQLGTGPIHFQPPGEPEVFLSIDTTLVPDDGWLNETNSYPLRLPPALGDGRFVEFGAELGIRWRPGPLNAVLFGGEVVPLAEPAVAEGVWSDESPSVVVYPGIYPGLDMIVTVRPGGLAVDLTGSVGLGDLEKEEIDAYRIDGDLEVEGFLMEALEERLGAGEPGELLPFYLGRGDDELVLSLEPGSLMGPETLRLLRELDRPFEPAEDEPIYLRTLDGETDVGARLGIEADEPMLAVAAIDDGSGMAPVEAIDLDRALSAGLRSAFQHWREEGRLFSYFRLSSDDSRDRSAVGSRTSALTASLSYRTVLRKTYFFGPGNAPFTLHYDKGCLPPCLRNRYKYAGSGMEAGNFADIWFARSVVPFKGIQQLAAQVDPKLGKTIKAMFLGFRDKPSFFRHTGRTAEDTDYIIASGLQSVQPYRGRASTSAKARETIWRGYGLRPYTATIRLLPGNQVASVSTWADKPATKTVDGKTFTFGAMSTAAFHGTAGSQTATFYAHEDLMKVLAAGDSEWLLGLHMPYEERQCVPCTGNHPSPSLDRSSGKMFVGAEFEDLRLEVLVEDSQSKEARIDVTTTGSASLARDLYPGETLTYDLELKSGSGFQWVDVVVMDSALPSGMSASFLPPSGSTPLTSWPRLRNPGDKARLILTWSGSMAAVPKPFDLDLYGRFDDRYWGGVFQSIRIRPRAPSGMVTLAPAAGSTPTMPDNMYEDLFRTLSIGAGGLRGADGVLVRLSLPGRKDPLRRGWHYTLHPAFASPGHPARIYVHPQRLAETYGGGRLGFSLEACLRSRYLARAACLKPMPVHLDLSSQSTGWPSVTRVTPWSADQQGAAATQVALKIAGGSLVDGATKPLVEITGAPNGGQPVRATGAVSTHSSTMVGAGVSLPGTARCGAYEVKLERRTGVAATSTFNLTRPFRDGVAHVVIEAESGQARVFGGTTAHRAASHGEAVGLVRGGTWLVVPFEVSTSATYRIFLRAAFTGAGVPLKVRLKRVNPDQTRTELKSLSTALRHPNRNFQINPIYQTATSTARAPFSLTTGELYELELENASVSSLLVDMVVLSAGTKMPLQSEICSK